MTGILGNTFLFWKILKGKRERLKAGWFWFESKLDLMKQRKVLNAVSPLGFCINKRHVCV